VLVFSDNVHEDGDLTKVPENDEKWQDRGNTALVYDDPYERHWDTWTGPKRPSLFTVKLFKDAGKHWHFGDKFYNVLNGTGHVSLDRSFALLAFDTSTSTRPLSHSATRAIMTCLKNTSSTLRKTQSYLRRGTPSKTFELPPYPEPDYQLNRIGVPRRLHW